MEHVESNYQFDSLYILENLKFEIQRDKSNKLYYSTMEIYYFENGIRKTFLKVNKWT